MKNVIGFLAIGLMAVVITGCSEEEAAPATTKATNNPAEALTKVALDTDLCGKCGCCAGCETCCKGEKCDGCGMQKGTALCCTGVKPAETDVVYCKGCGHEKGSDSCCADTNEKCTDCGLAKGSPICCKVTSDDAHDHDGDVDHKDDGDHAEG